VYLAWKSASRWSDVNRIVGSSVVSSNPTRIIIEWRDRTKTTRTDPYRHDSWTVIEAADGAVHPPQVLRALSELQPHEFLWARPTDWLERLIEKTFPGRGLTAHSIKAGAVAMLSEAALAGLVPLDLISIVAKHKLTTHPIQQTTLRYMARDPVQTALLLGTQKATKWILWQ
jgi:hypothetical protein